MSLRLDGDSDLFGPKGRVQREDVVARVTGLGAGDSGAVLNPPDWAGQDRKPGRKYVFEAPAAEYGTPSECVARSQLLGDGVTGFLDLVSDRLGCLADRSMLRILEHCGDGLQSRCFAHVLDVVGALVRLSGHPEAIGQVFNVGNEQEITILALAERIRALTGGRSTIRKIPYNEAYTAGFEDMRRRVPDLSKIHRLIGYRPTRDLDKILGDIVAEQTRGVV